MMQTLLAPNQLATAVCDLLIFDVGAERFAMPLSTVEEVVDGCGLQDASDATARYRLLRVRHELIAAFDPARVLMSSRVESEPVALVLPSARGLIALLVDSAYAVPQADVSSLRTPPGLMTADRVLEGVLRVGERWVGLVNTGALVDALLADLSTSGESTTNSSAPFSSGNHGR